MKSIKLNLGCGNKYLEGYNNCDHLTHIKKDTYIDLNTFPYPFKNNYADEILMDNVLEHLDNVVRVIEEIHRILKKDGMVKIVVPYAKSEGALQDPTHRHLFTEKSMNYFDDNFSYNYYTKAHFSIQKAQLLATEDTLTGKIRAVIPFRPFLKRFLFNMYDYVYFEMKAVK